MVDRLVSVVPESLNRVVAIRLIQEDRSRLPLFLTQAQTARAFGHLALRFRNASEPASQQVAVRTFGNGRTVIMAWEQRTAGVAWNVNEPARSLEVWLGRVRTFHQFRSITLNNIALIQRRQRPG